MAKWLPLPPSPLYSQKNQQDFLEARRKRWCTNCKFEYEVISPVFFCPKCQTKGIRFFDRLTIIAGRRWGKSKFGSIAGVEEACIPNTIGWACAPTNPKLHRYVIPAFQQLIPQDWVQDYNSEFQDLRLKNGSLIHFQTLEDPDQGRGQGLDWLWIDEVCELTEAHWEVISPSLGDKQGVAFFTTSPRSFDWVYEKLYKPAEDGVEGFWGLHAKTSDNPLFQTPEGRAFLAREKASKDPLMYRQEYEADFVTFEGAVYGSTLDDQILRDHDRIKAIIPEWTGHPDSIAPWRQVLVGIDSGADHPFGGVKLVSTEHGLVVVGEYLERNKSYIEHSAELKRLANNPNVKWAINKNEKQGMIELAQHKIFCQAAENDQIAGIERVKSWIFRKKIWFLEAYCTRTIKQMKAYRYAENTSPKDQQKRVEKVFKKNDELPDCLRYALMSWPRLPDGPPETAKPERDISNLPEEMQASIIRMRKIENMKTEPTSFTGDFWS